MNTKNQSRTKTLAGKFPELVAQIFNLPYRRLAACAGWTSTNTPERSTPCRLQVGDTADFKSALHGLGAALARKMCEISRLAACLNGRAGILPASHSIVKCPTGGKLETCPGLEIRHFKHAFVWLPMLAVLLTFGVAAPTAAELIEKATPADAHQATLNDPGQDSKKKESKQEQIVTKVVVSDGKGEEVERKSLPWLGVSTEEVSDVLTSQLGLDPAVGLVVTYVAPESPAAKSGLQKNDVLVEFESHSLVHPAQLRKLVQSRKEDDTVKLVFYRAGKKQSVSATLGKTTARLGLLGEEHRWQGDLRELERQLRDLPIGEALRDAAKMKGLRDSLGQVRIDREEVQKGIRQSVEQVRKGIQEALRHATNRDMLLGPAAKVLRDLAHGDVEVSKDATVTVNSAGASVKTMVKADDTGTYVIVANPRKRLTVHDKEGNLKFDGEIETSEQQDKVPKEIWEKAKPMVEKLKGVKDKEPKAESDSSKETTSIDSDDLVVGSDLAPTRTLPSPEYFTLSVAASVF
ncbi:MAG: PDZ domain-containing protein [Verrucomicrobia bacterium]|nr:PDZ domain-containing protein [Verrucomicrobiota bacterium]